MNEPSRAAPGVLARRGGTLAPDRSLRRHRWFLAEYLVAQLQALAADSRVTGRRHGRDLIAAFPAEAAWRCPGPMRYLLDRGDGCADRPAWLAHHRVCAARATVADASARSDDQLLDLLLALSAEGARQKAAEIGHLPTVSTEIG